MGAFVKKQKTTYPGNICTSDDLITDHESRDYYIKLSYFETS